MFGWIIQEQVTSAVALYECFTRVVRYRNNTSGVWNGIKRRGIIIIKREKKTHARDNEDIEQAEAVYQLVGCHIILAIFPVSFFWFLANAKHLRLLESPRTDRSGSRTDHSGSRTHLSGSRTDQSSPWTPDRNHAFFYSLMFERCDGTDWIVSALVALWGNRRRLITEDSPYQLCTQFVINQLNIFRNCNADWLTNSKISNWVAWTGQKTNNLK